MNTDRSNINLKDLLEYMGEDIIPHGNRYYKLREHDSLIINGNKFYWNSRQVGGNYFTLLKELYGLDNKKIWETTQKFLDAVEYGEYKPKEINKLNIEEKEKIFRKRNLNEKKSINKIKEYLSEKRFIDEKFIDSLYHNNLLYMDYRNNIVFSITDKNGEKTGEEVIGTGVMKYRRNTSRSEGFNLTRIDPKINPEIKNLYIFEGTIDMLSYIQLNQKEIKDKWKNENVRFLTLSGLREDILENYIDKIENVYVCTDNDSAGEKFYEKIKNKYQNINFYREKSIEKDWNEDLAKKEYVLDVSNDKWKNKSKENELER